MFTRLKLTAIRERLDSLLDEAIRVELDLRGRLGLPVRGRDRAQRPAAV
jgi:hypothetical protein